MGLTGAAPADRTLVEGIARGDAGALRQLERKYGGTLFALAYAALLDPEAADDVVTAVFADAVAYAEIVLTQPERILTWLVQIAQIHVAEHVRPGTARRPRLTASQARLRWLHEV